MLCRSVCLGEKQGQDREGDYVCVEEMKKVMCCVVYLCYISKFYS